MITLRKVHVLSDKEWEVITGSSMYIAMLANRIAVIKPLAAERKTMNLWCSENCTASYYFDLDSGVYYFLSEQDATHFWLAMSGTDK